MGTVAHLLTIVNHYYTYFASVPNKFPDAIPSASFHFQNPVWLTTRVLGGPTTINRFDLSKMYEIFPEEAVYGTLIL